MSNSNHYGVWARSLDSVWHDVRLALRMVRRSPGFSATIALTLAVGIGANAAIFGVINSLLLRPLPVADPHRLVTVSSDAAIARGQAGVPWSFAMWEELQPHASLFDGAFGVDARTIRPGGARRAAARGRDLRQRRVLRDARRRGDSRPHVHAGRRSPRRRAGRRRSPSSATDSGNGASEGPTTSSVHRSSSTARGHDRRSDGTGVPGTRRRERIRRGVAARNGAAHPSAAARRSERRGCWSCCA